MRARECIGATALAAFLILGCDRAERTASGGPPDFSGSIVHVSRPGQRGGAGAVLQIDVAEPGPEFQPVTTDVTARTEVFVDSGGARWRGDARALEPGQHADVWSANGAGGEQSRHSEATKIVVRARNNA